MAELGELVPTARTIQQFKNQRKYLNPQANVTAGYLMQWGPVTFKVYPLNIHEYDHHTEADWAPKEIAGAAIYREWVGENDETLHFRGRIFPYHKIGGMPEIQVLEAKRRNGLADQMIRGDGVVLGWYVCERLSREHTYLSAEGIGQQVSFEAQFARVPGPGDPNLYLANLNSVLTG
jgi:phage tail protein